MIDHLSLGVRDLARALRFYDAALAPLGYARIWQNARGAGYGSAPGSDARSAPGSSSASGSGGAPGSSTASPDEKLALFVDASASAAGAGAHIALTAQSAAAVDAFFAAALANGGSDEGAPGPRARYGAGYYAAFVRDPDGHKLEAVHHG